MSVRSCTKCGEALGHYPGPLCNSCDLISPRIGANQCEHGQLARVCEVCELKARLARAKEIAMKIEHRMPCIRRYPQIEGECSCGLDDLWRELSM